MRIYSFRFVYLNSKQNKTLNYVNLNAKSPLKSRKKSHSLISERGGENYRIFDSQSLKKRQKALKISI